MRQPISDEQLEFAERVRPRNVDFAEGQAKGGVCELWTERQADVVLGRPFDGGARSRPRGSGFRPA